jgi:Chromo (CHRromatin Organisation MOdifier) domain
MAPWPDKSQVHPVFHVSQLKEKIGTGITVSPELPIIGNHIKLRSESVAVWDRRIVKGKGEPVAQILVRWSNLPDSDATWEDYLSIKQ